MKRLCLAWLALLLAACSGPPPDQDTPVGVSQALGGDPEPGFARATDPRPFSFPADHGAHPDFKNEWWYLTGNLAAPSGRRFGYQVTLFRIALAPESALRASRWATRQVWMAHVALTDVAAGTHQARERLARQALGLAGAGLDPFRVWLEDWRLDGTGNDFPWHLGVDAGDFALELELAGDRPMLQGDQGLSQKSAEPGNASYYYSLPRLATQGEIRAGDQRYPVQGLSWLDREWSTSSLGPDQVGWDWLSLQFQDGTDLMYYQLRRRDGSPDPHSRGAARLADGRRLDLLPAEVKLIPREFWTSPQGRRYPIVWDLDTPAQPRQLRVRALLPDQLMELSVRYWEGAVEILDRDGGARLGYGYLEMTGY